MKRNRIFIAVICAVALLTGVLAPARADSTIPMEPGLRLEGDMAPGRDTLILLQVPGAGKVTLKLEGTNLNARVTEQSSGREVASGDSGKLSWKSGGEEDYLICLTMTQQKGSFTFLALFEESGQEAETEQTETEEDTEEAEPEQPADKAEPAEENRDEEAAEESAGEEPDPGTEEEAGQPSTEDEEADPAGKNVTTDAEEGHAEVTETEETPEAESEKDPSEEDTDPKSEPEDMNPESEPADAEPETESAEPETELGEAEPETEPGDAEPETAPGDMKPEEDQDARHAETPEAPDTHPDMPEKQPAGEDDQTQPEQGKDGQTGVEMKVTKNLLIDQSWEGVIKHAKPTVLKLDLSAPQTVHMLVEGSNICAKVRKADRDTDTVSGQVTVSGTDRMVVTWTAEAGSWLISLNANEGSLLERAGVSFLNETEFQMTEAEKEQETSDQPETVPGEPEDTQEEGFDTETQGEPVTEPDPESEQETGGDPADTIPRSISVDVTFDTPNPVIGDTAHFKAVLAGYENLPHTMQWQYSTDRGQWTDITGATGETMDVVVDEDNNRYYWRIMVYVEEEPADGIPEQED